MTHKPETVSQNLAIDFEQPIPLFPLPNAVLLPSAIIPLHLFEPRYQDMARDTLADQKLLAMAFLRPGYAEKYYTHHASIFPVVCLGRIVRDEPLDDGRHNILLQGVCRAKVRREDHERSYRRAWLMPIHSTNGLSHDDAERIRRRLLHELESGAESALCVTDVLRRVVECPHLSISDMIDLLAHNVINDPVHRQRFLAERDVVRRSACLIELLACIRSKRAEAQSPTPASGPAPYAGPSPN